MKVIAAAVVATLLAATLSGCAYRPLKAPCSAEEGGTALGYAALEAFPEPDAFQHVDRCGPMRPI